ncbi:hypothetical protein GCM10009825_22560 [Arthrobacter humicola]|uniref:Uncharacterized protein n=1 Tax=Arthrobacter humicola TaxID=409291 RepID=A0ABN2Z500_9MICC
MKAKMLVIVGVGVAAIFGGTALALDQKTAGPAADSSVAAAAGNSVPTAQSSANPSKTEAGTGTGATEGTATPTGGSAGGPSRAPGREVLPPASAPPSGLPAPSAPPALIRTPLPPTASAQGKIVDGFPIEVLRFPEGSVVVSTGVSATDGALQVAADAIVASSQDSVVGHFQQILGPLKFWSEPVRSAEGQRAVRFSRGKDSLTLTTSTTGTGGTRFMLLGNLHPAGG